MIQKVKPNRWSISPKLLHLKGSSSLLPMQGRSCSPFSGDMEGVVHMEFLELGQPVKWECELSNSEPDAFGVTRTQSCNTTMRARTPVAKLKTA
ncbi:hypothetical protein ElyMa_005842800 [Elysia marginata]|uniref:Uncharacterized protein n=1 Tax=Elysia marginata TaxID=1093978 RepID=A0AAV4FZ50_9GAST|nr:hypothetical protein ElyMa_005842800 [Elysia marginata]